MEGGVSTSNASQSPIIRPINKSVVHRICAGQVILDLSSAVKELVENSLDSGATSIEIALKEYGKESFQVIDNGCGISPNNFQVLALKHHTSKLSDFPDLQSLTTFGFRGEALSSLCALGDLTVETKTENEVVGTHLTYDRSGLLKSERKIARQVGTTVTVKNLFSYLPVRCKEFHRNIRKEYGKLICLLNAYALISKGVRLVCTNTTAKDVKSVVLKTQGSKSLKDNIITVFGVSTFSCLQHVSVATSDGIPIVEGFVSKPGNGSGRNISDRQFFFVNGRPVDMPKIGKLVNELYRGANSKQYPMALLNFSISIKKYDVNVTPDKRKIFFSDENSILQSLRDALEKIYSPNNQVSFSVNRVEELNNNGGDFDSEFPIKQLFSDVEEEISCPNIRNFELKTHGNKKRRFSTTPDKEISDFNPRPARKGLTDNGRSSIGQTSLNDFVTVHKRKHESDDSTLLSESPLLRSGPTLSNLSDKAPLIRTTIEGSRENCSEFDESNGSEPKPAKITRVESVFDEAERSIKLPSGDKNLSEAVKSQAMKSQERTKSDGDSVEISLPSTNIQLLSRDPLDEASPLHSSGVSIDSPVVSSGAKVGFTLQFSIKDLISRRKQRLSRLQCVNHSSENMKLKRGFAAATLELSESVNDDGKARALAAATSELERLFKKEYFNQMKVIGQFNLGFIIGKLDQDLFIVDQHAADEKYNYEHLSQSTVLNQQPLLRPLKMELSPEEEIVISMHMEMVRKNGFLLEEDMQAPPGHRYKLKAVPFSKNITFGVADVKELISLLSDTHGDCSIIGSYRSDTADSICPPKVRSMLASRACRSSVMIGDALGRNEMHKILRHLSVLKSPWNCPHGRPTMRHLVDLRTLHATRNEEETAL